MILRYCNPDVTLVEADYWQPTNDFDCSSRGNFGCSRLKCHKCNEMVRWTIIDKPSRFRRYQCLCQSVEQFYATHVLRSEPNWADHRIATAWYCDGHPQITLPMELDGIALDEGNWPAIVQQTLATPPFVAPGVGERTKSFWVQRFYYLLWTEKQRTQVGEAVAEQLGSDSPELVSAALDFFFDNPRAAGHMEVAELACSGKDRLLAMRNPKYPTRTLYPRVLEVANRLLTDPQPGKAPTDTAALEVVRAAILNGDAKHAMVYGLAMRDPQWFMEHAKAIVVANPSLLDAVMLSLKDYFRAEQREAPLKEIATIGPEANEAVDALLTVLDEKS